LILIYRNPGSISVELLMSTGSMSNWIV